jgi:dTDP-glucose 4,6-dehydratase
MTVPGRLLVTGGAGFIGSAFVRRQLGEQGSTQVVVLDKLTYAGNLANLADVEGDPHYRFVRGDINDAALVDELAANADAIVNFAAESHVDRSIETPDAFIQTDVHGTFTLLEAARRHRHTAYLQVSTDEVYGHVAEGSSRETDSLRPRSPYAASKAAADLLTLAYATTYGLPARVTRGSNTFGPHQYPEKVIPLFVTNAIDMQPLPLYGDGRQVRDWLYVEDHCAAIELVLDRGADAEVYNVGGGNLRMNLELTHRILDLLDRPADLIRNVPDRAGHDRRYSVDCSKLHRLGWQPRHAFDDALAATVAWYREHPDWWRPLKQGDYLEYYRRQYEARLAAATPRS